jgi:hypothetical protein
MLNVTGGSSMSRIDDLLTYRQGFGMARKPGTSSRRSPSKAPARGSMTFRGAEYTAEWRGLVMAAAKRSGETQSAYIHRVMTADAQRVLKGEPEAPAGPPPAVVGDELAQELRRFGAALEKLRGDNAALSARLEAVESGDRVGPVRRMREAGAALLARLRGR